MKKLTLMDLPKRDLAKLVKLAGFRLTQQEIAATIVRDKLMRMKALKTEIDADLEAMNNIRGKKRIENAARKVAVKVDRHERLREASEKIYEQYGLANLIKEGSNDEKDADRSHQNAAAAGQA